MPREAQVELDDAVEFDKHQRQAFTTADGRVHQPCWTRRCASPIAQQRTRRPKTSTEIDEAHSELQRLRRKEVDCSGDLGKLWLSVWLCGFLAPTSAEQGDWS